MTKPSIDRIIRDSRDGCLALSQGEAKVMVDEIVRLRAALSNLSNAAAIVYAAFKPISGPDETAKALLRMELGLKD